MATMSQVSLLMNFRTPYACLSKDTRHELSQYPLKARHYFAYSPPVFLWADIILRHKEYLNGKAT